MATAPAPATATVHWITSAVTTIASAVLASSATTIGSHSLAMRATCSITPTPAGTNSSDRCFSSSTQVGRSAATALLVDQQVGEQQRHAEHRAGDRQRQRVGEHLADRLEHEQRGERLQHGVRSAAAQPLVEPLDPVPHAGCRCPPARCVMQPMLADRITSGRGACRWPSLRSRSCVGELRLQHRVRAGRAAAQVRVGDRQHLRAERREQRLDRAPHLLAVLQGARRVERHAALGRRRQRAASSSRGRARAAAPPGRASAR